MIDWNPTRHMQNAWSNTKTPWGKFALVLFYGLIWANIVLSVWSLISPDSQGNDCLMSLAAAGETTTATTTTTGGNHHDVVVTAMIRSCSVLLIGFMFYADCAGLKVKNVFLVTIVMIAYAWCFHPLMNTLNEECDQSWISIWIFPIWAFVAFVFTILEDKLADKGTAEETTPLVSQAV